MEGLALELKQWTPKIFGKELVSVYFGGGTPSLLGPENIGKILSLIPHDLKNAEITLEANPENITKELMQAYADAGINRVSIGIQSFDDALLKALGRVHDAKKAQDAALLTAQAGIENISIDLMYDLPGQTLQAWEYTLNVTQQLPITHLSLYNLVIEPHTPFYKRRKTLQPTLPSEELSLAMYEMAIQKLSILKQYEISAFGNPSKHNTGYWTGRPFLGFGPSAFSYWEGKRFRVVANLNRYIQELRLGKSPVDFEEELPFEGKQRELLAINLRLLSGVNLDVFQKQHGPLNPEMHKILFGLEQQGYLKQQDSIWCLTKKGILFYDTLASEIVL